MIDGRLYTAKVDMLPLGYERSQRHQGSAKYCGVSWIVLRIPVSMVELTHR